MILTSHERIMRIFQNKEIDRPALKLWGAGLDGEYRLLHPMYKPVSKLASEITDLFVGCSMPFEMYCGKNADKYCESWLEDMKNPLWKKQHTVFHTPKGDLHMIRQVSTVGEPSYIIEQLIKEPEDFEKLLSMEYEPYPIDRNAYDTMVRKVGDRGAVLVDLPHPGYALQILLGSEQLAYFSIDYREELLEVCDIFAKRVMEHTKSILDTGIVAPFSWVGPELFLPPLMGPNDFKEFVHDIDKPLADLIHNAGGYVWVHSHGMVTNFIDSFIDMGVDILNPLEPPKNGDIYLDKIVEKYGNRIGWEGNIEIQDLLLSSPDRVKELIDECVACGSKSGRFILCPSAGFNEYAHPTQQYIDNLILYLNYGFEAVNKCRQ